MIPTTTTPSAKDAGRYDPKELRRLKISPEVGWYLYTRGIPLPTCPPRFKTPEPRKLAGAKFDPERVDLVLRVFGLLRHTQGQWAGRPLNPDPWQIAYLLAPVYGWVRKNDAGHWVRIIRTQYVELPRKNGKTTLAGGQACDLTCADGEAGAQVIAAAAGKDQARFCFDPIKTIAEKSPALSPHVKVLRDRITHPKSGSYFAVVSSLADLIHGANLHGGVIDELHVHKSPDLVEAITTGTGAREQPLIVIITTPDDGKPNTVYAHTRARVEQLARGALKDPSVYGVIWCADARDDPHAESTWRKANPGYGVSPTREFMVAASAKAASSPADLASFQRLHLGLRTKQTTKYITLAAWERNAGPRIDEADLAGRECFGGLDLASTSDITALCWLFPAEDGSFDAIWRLWIPEDNLEALDKRTAGAATAWVREGWLLTTPGNVTDYDYIKAQILADAEVFDVQDIAYDRWNSSQMVNDLVAEDMPMSPIGQGYASLSAPTKELQRLVLAGSRSTPMIRHGGNPVLIWMIDNLAVLTDAAGNVKPAKDKSADKIDGVAAAVNALERTMRTEAPGDSVYEERGLIIL
jgi:phage terminase large subunit-like protein